MPNGDKFTALRQFFHTCSKEIVNLTFKDVERLLGVPLPDSAHRYAAYWHGGKTKHFPSAWLEEGYVLEHLSMINQTATFVRVKLEATPIAIDSHTETLGHVASHNKAFLEPELAIEKIKAYDTESQAGENGRYLSWEHCYSHFAQHRGYDPDEGTIDLLCLHLAFYLASWGMYRGSSFLLQRDYRIHREAVLELVKTKYASLWGASCETLVNPKSLDLLQELAERVERIYVARRASVDGRTSVSTILLTKILLGTIGCVPAYDRFFMAGVGETKVASGQFGKKSILSLARYYLQNKDMFERCRLDITSRGQDYPPMKLIDMCFWQIGYESDLNQAELETSL
jgi:hypothetical protein